MTQSMIIQGRSLQETDIEYIRNLISVNKQWNRRRLSQAICQDWQWYNECGQMKDMACRSMLLKLDRQGHIQLPAPRRSSKNVFRPDKIEPELHAHHPVAGSVGTLGQIRLRLVDKSLLGLFKTFLSLYHYIGYSGSVGENLKYLIYDHQEIPLGCLQFGSAAWSIAARDRYIGWDGTTRKRNLRFVTNNMRFLILPWVRVRYLASHILSKVARRISADWEARYGHPVYLLETFVERDRFQGTSYQAANWVKVGQTKGRSRNDRDNTLLVPVKDIYLYPLDRHFRRLLSQ